jgi:hypothetical protein
MLGSFGAPLTEKFLVRRLSANFRTLIRNGRAPGRREATRRTAPMSADHASVPALAPVAASKLAHSVSADQKPRAITGNPDLLQRQIRALFDWKVWL